MKMRPKAARHCGARSVLLQPSTHRLHARHLTARSGSSRSSKCAASRSTLTIAVVRLRNLPVSRALRYVIDVRFWLLIAVAALATAIALSRLHWPAASGRSRESRTLRVQLHATPVTLTYSYQNMFDGGLLMPNGQPLPDAAHSRFDRRSARPVGQRRAAALRRSRRRRTLLLRRLDPVRPDSFPAHLHQRPRPAPAGAADRQGPGLLPVQQRRLSRRRRVRPQRSVAGSRHTAAARHPRRHNPRARPHARPGPHRPLAGQHVLDLHRIRRPRHRVLHQDDIDGIQYIYGEGIGSVTPLGVPEPASAALLLLAAGWWLARSAAPISGQ